MHEQAASAGGGEGAGVHASITAWRSSPGREDMGIFMGDYFLFMEMWGHDKPEEF